MFHVKQTSTARIVKIIYNQDIFITFSFMLNLKQVDRPAQRKSGETNALEVFWHLFDLVQTRSAVLRFYRAAGRSGPDSALG